MSQLDQYVNASADDWTEGNPASTTGNTLTVRYLSNTATVSAGYCLIDTSSIPDDATITGATFYWYDHAYLQPKGAGVNSSVAIWDNSSSYILLHNFTEFTAGQKSHALESGELVNVNKTGDTKFRFSTAERSGKDRTWDIRAYDGYSGSNEQPRLVVNYTEASAGGRSKTRILR